MCRLVEREDIASHTIPIAEETREDFSIFESDSCNQYRFVMPGPIFSDSEGAACLDSLSQLARARKDLAWGNAPCRRGAGNIRAEVQFSPDPKELVRSDCLQRWCT